MATRKKLPAPEPTPHTGAWLAFEENLDSILHVVALQSRETSALTAATARLQRSLKARAVPLQSASDAASQKAAKDKVVRAVQRFSKISTTSVERILVVNLWAVVMIVTFVEAYIQDVLSAAASVERKLMAKSEQRALYADVLAAESIEALANGMRVRWARAWVTDGGPTRWIKRLEAMGVSKFPADLAGRLELLWGIRHVVVHSAGFATSDFATRHPRFGATPGARVRVSSPTLTSFIGAMTDFVTPTEEFFLGRFPSLVAPPPKRA